MDMQTGHVKELAALTEAERRETLPGGGKRWQPIENVTREMVEQMSDDLARDRAAKALDKRDRRARRAGHRRDDSSEA